MRGGVFLHHGQFFVTFAREGEVLDQAGPFDDAEDAVEVARRWASDVDIACNTFEPGAW